MSNVYQIVTERILGCMDRGVVPWRKGWHARSPRNMVSGREYRGVNVLLLQAAPYQSEWWLTFKQARDLGGTVRRGEHGCPVVYFKSHDDENAAEREQDRRRFVARYFTVFSVEQCEGICAPPSVAPAPFDPIAACEQIVSGYRNPPTIYHGGNVACYVPSRDAIHIPSHAAFAAPTEYYSTLFHEIVHSSGAAHRLARKGVVDGARFASHTYSAEELVAEIGAAFLCAEGGIAPATLENSAAYVDHWSRALRSNPRWLVEASGQAAKSADFVLGRASSSNEQTPQQAA